MSPEEQEQQDSNQSHDHAATRLVKKSFLLALATEPSGSGWHPWIIQSGGVETLVIQSF